MSRVKIAPSYTEEWLEVERPQPLSDNLLEQTIQEVLSGKINSKFETVYDDFKLEASAWINNSSINKLSGLDSFSRIDVINGCTQFIDNLYMQGPLQTIRSDYKYHERLGHSYVKDVGSLIPGIPLVIAMPFPRIGAPHPNMEEILNEATTKHIDVHIDGAWITCCRDVHFEFCHPAIKSVGISLSKGLGLGWNRIGLRWTNDTTSDSISIMNDFHMNLRATALIGLHFIRSIAPDYLWNTHGFRYYKVCKDFGLTPTNSIYLALRQGQPVGVSPLIRYLENNE